MLFLVNLARKFREVLPTEKTQTKFFDFSYNSAIFFGKLRGFKSKIYGRVICKKRNRELIFGRKVDFHLEHGSAIVLEDDNNEHKKQHPMCEKYPSASLFGMRNHWRLLNHPEYNGSRLRLMKNARLALEPNVKITIGTCISIWPEKTLRIGSGTSISHGVMINTRCGLNIGRNVIIAREAILMDYDGHPVFKLDKAHLLDEKETYGGNSQAIVIEDNVWIGFRAMIMKGVKIGKGSIVSAYSCVYQDVPENSVVAGNPAKVIKQEVSWRLY
jgi:acetyltransferase-like isoleucine patch superfamily enzyme